MRLFLFLYLWTGLGFLTAFLIAYGTHSAAGSGMTPDSVLATELGRELAREIHICSPGIDCKNSSHVCGPEYICIINTVSPSPSYTGPPRTHSPSPSQHATIMPSKSFEPSESAMPKYSVMVAVSPTLQECNSCKTHTQCISDVCHHHKCVQAGANFTASLTKCFGNNVAQPVASAAPKMPVIMVF